MWGEIVPDRAARRRRDVPELGRTACNRASFEPPTLFAYSAPRLLSSLGVTARAAFNFPGTAHLSPRGRRALKIAVAALVGIPWIPLAAALYAWMR